MIRSWRELTWVELKLFVREPVTVVFVLILPVVFLYVLNGVFAREGADPSVWEGLGAVDFYASSYVALVVATVGILGLPVHLAGYREQGVLRRFRASPLPPLVLLAAHAAVAAVFATVGAVLVVVLAVLGYDASVPRNWAGVIAAYLLVVAAFAAIGVVLGLLLPTARAAQSLGVLLFFVFMLLGGAGPPREVLPRALQAIGDFTPMTYAARLIRAPWTGRTGDGTALAVVVGVLVAGVVLAVVISNRRAG